MAAQPFLVHVDKAVGLRSADFMGKVRSARLAGWERMFESPMQIVTGWFDSPFPQSDPYCRISIDGAKFTTRVIDNDNNPEWNEMFLIFCPPGGASTTPRVSLVSVHHCLVRRNSQLHSV